MVPLETGIRRISFVALIMMLLSVFAWLFIQNNILPLFLKVFLNGTNEDWLNLFRFAVPVFGWLYYIYIHDKLFKGKPTRYKTGFAEGMYKTFQKIDEAVTRYETTGDNSEIARTARSLRVGGDIRIEKCPNQW